MTDSDLLLFLVIMRNYLVLTVNNFVLKRRSPSKRFFLFFARKNKNESRT